MAQQQPTSVFRLFNPLFYTIRRSTSTLTTSSRTSSLQNANQTSASRHFSTTPPTMAQGKGRGAPKKDPRITLIRYHLMHPKTPRPLRFSRLRALRHWTIHRAWMLFRRKKQAKEELELQRMYQSMAAACEELRLLDGLDTKEGSRLFRIAMEKKGIFRPGGVPIEYARAQTETPGTEAWNHNWTR